MNKTTEAFDAWWSDTGEQSLFALNTTTDDDIKILAGLAWEAAIREALAESKPAPDGRIPKTVFTLDDIGKAAEMGRQAGMVDALAEPVKQEPVAHYKDAPHTIYLQTGCDDPDPVNCECAFNEWGDTTWCVDQIHDTDIPYIRADYAAPVSAKREWIELTDDEIYDALAEVRFVRDNLLDGCRALIAAFKERNK